MKTEEQVGKWWTPRLARPVAAAAGVRLALLAFGLARTGTSALIRPDTGSYLEPGRNLLLHGSYIGATGLPELVRTPGYPLFLALLSLAGPGIAAVAQVILSVFSVVLVWRLAHAVFGDDRIALVAAWIFAFEPLSVIYSVILLSETLFLTLFLLSMERLVKFLRGRQLRVLAVAGLWLAASTFVRPVTYYLPVALALGLFLVLSRVPGLRWKAPALLLISVLPWLVVWQIRNWAETGFSGISSIGIESVYFFQAAEVTARVEHRSLEEVQQEFGSQFPESRHYLSRHPEQEGWTYAQRLAFMNLEADHILRAHPGIFLRTQLEGSMRVAFNPGAADLMAMLLAYPINPGTLARALDEGPKIGALRLNKANASQAIVMAALEFVLIGLYLLAARGAVRGGAPNSCIWLLVGVSLYFLLLSGGAAAVARYRLPIMPVVCILAAAGIWKSRPQATND